MITTYRNGKAYPYKLPIDENTIQISENLIRLFQESIDSKRCEIEEEVMQFQQEKFNPKALQGLAKILFDRCEFAQPDFESMSGLRSDVFDMSANYWKTDAVESVEYQKHQLNILQKLKDSGNQSEADENGSWLYADISDNALLGAFAELTAEELIHRFNIEQIQGLLIHSESMILNLPKKRDATFRQVMQMLKFFRLMFDVNEDQKETLKITVDGPGSILENSRSYGLEIANFFPAVLLLKSPWQLKATLRIKGKPRKFTLELNEQNPYQTFYRSKGVMSHEKVKELVKRFREKFSDGYKISTNHRVVRLRRNNYLLPDFSIKKYDLKDSQERFKEVQVEWVQYLSKSKIDRLIGIRDELPENYVFAVKGKRQKLKDLSQKMGDHLFIFTNQLTKKKKKKFIDRI